MPPDNTTLAYKTSASHVMMLGDPHMLECAEGRQDGSSNPYWELSMVIKHFQFLEEFCNDVQAVNLPG